MAVAADEELRPPPLDGFVVGITANRGSSQQAALLGARGAAVLHGPGLSEAVAFRRVHAVTFTSAAAVRGLLTLAGQTGVADGVLDALSTTVLGACAGARAAAAARAAGFVPLVPHDAGVSGLIDALAEALCVQERRLHIGDERVVLRGTVVELRSSRLVLADREAAVFGALARRPGRVVPKRALLDEVWGRSTTDPHVVEVTVARLRRRLGTLGDRVVVVPRRGYLLDARDAG